MTEKISLTQQDEPSVSPEIFAGTVSRLSQSGSRRSPAAGAPPAPTKIRPGDAFLPARYLRIPGPQQIVEQ